jgi:GT2 family glycosyltransferase
VTAVLPDLSVIVVNWNTRDLLIRCINSLESHAKDGQVQAIVVDNGSRDGSQEVAESMFPWVTLIANRDNVGFARANNQAGAIATAPLLLFLNSDAALLTGAVDSIVNFMSCCPDVGVVGLSLLNDDLSPQRSGKRFPTVGSTIVGLLPVPMRWRKAFDLRRNARNYATAAQVDEVSGAAMAIRTDLFRAVGGFDERFYFFGEDIDLCWRAKELGYRVAYLPSAQAIHTWGSARAGRTPIWQGLMSQRAQFMLIGSHKPACQTMALRCTMLGLTVSRCARSVLAMAVRSTTARHSISNQYAHQVLWLLSFNPDAHQRRAASRASDDISPRYCSPQPC